MQAAVNYRAWILRRLQPWLTGRTLEIGAGVGAYAPLLAERSDAVFSIEPSRAQYEQLVQATTSLANVTARCSLLEDVREEVTAFQPTTAVLINVLEHVEHDVALLNQVRAHLAPGGAVCVFVPALPWLMSPFDVSIGHFRRYLRTELTGKLRAGGFKVQSVHYMDSLGVLPWLVQFRLLRSRLFEYKQVLLYDRLVVPWLSRLENRWSPPFGKNLLAVATKSLLGS